ncbi:hypothetical protein G6F68_017459 [Rhizopus microsporus]|nr:hypothetical protein G6F68_017459 [Rhizopus microsporus]
MAALSAIVRMRSLIRINDGTETPSPAAAVAGVRRPVAGCMLFLDQCLIHLARRQADRARWRVDPARSPAHRRGHRRTAQPPRLRTGP